MKRLLVFIFGVTIIGSALAQEHIKLPQARHEGDMSIEQAIYERKAIRNFTEEPVTIKEVAQILWSTQGVTVDGVTGPTRAYPSAGALYPLEVYLVAGNVRDIDPGVYKYDWRNHGLVMVKKGDFRKALSKASLNQGMIREAPITIVVTAIEDKVKKRYGDRGVVRYVGMDAGHLGQNVHLQAQGMGLGTVMVGAFNDDEVALILGITGEKPVYVMPIGWPER